MQRPTQAHPRPRPNREGAVTFRHQRLSAAVLAVLVPLGVLLIAYLAERSIEDSRAVLANPVVSAPLAVLILAGTYHMWIGMHEIIEDYIHGKSTNGLLRMLNSAYASLVALACLYAVVKLAFGT